MKKYIYPLIFSALLSMGAKECTVLKGQPYINTQYRNGQYIATVEDNDSFCADDPFWLDTYGHLKSNLSLILGGPIPRFLSAERYGLSSNNGPFYYSTVLGTIPAVLTTYGNTFSTGEHYFGLMWEASGYIYNPVTCLANNWNCPYISITASPPLSVNIVSGWQNFNNGQSCWNSWPNRFITCDKVGSREPYWWECFLPVIDSEPAL